MSYSVVQYRDTGISNPSSGTGLSLTANPSSSNIVVAIISASGGGKVTGVSGLGATWTAIGSGAAGSRGTDQWWIATGLSGSAKTITPTGASYYAAALEIAPSTSLFTDGGGSAQTTTTPSITIGNVASGDMVLAFCDCANNNTAQPGSPWTVYPGSGYWAAGQYFSLVYQVASSAGTLTASWTIQSGGNAQAVLGLVVGSVPAAANGNFFEFLRGG